MSKTRSSDPKIDALVQRGCLNSHPEKVLDPLFVASDFFDSRDLVQVKYEMVRRARKEGKPVGQSAKAFGFSRPAFYQAEATLAREGLCGLVPKKRGPRRAHKLSAEVMSFVQELLSKEASQNASQLAGKIEKRFSLQVHPRSIERALGRQEKKRR